MPRLTQKGQVTIPAAVRQQLGLETGDEVDFQEIDGRIVLGKKAPPKKTLADYLGYLNELRGADPDDLVREMRDADDLRR